MSYYRLITLILWLSAPTMLLILLVRVAYLKLWNACPIFFYYLTFVVAKTGVLLLAGHSGKAYFLVYWIGDFVEAVLVVAILYQLYSYLFRDYSGFGALQNALFRWSAAVSILVSVMVAARVHGGDPSRIMAGVLALSLASAVVKAGLILFVIVLSEALALRWGHYAFGVLVGLGLYTTVEMASVAALLQYGPPASATFQLIKPGAYTCAVIVWVVFFLSKEQRDASANVLPENDLAAWNQALMEILTR